jgi:hypothetical protein
LSRIYAWDVMMSDVFRIPYPQNYPSDGWAVYGNNVLKVLAALILYRRAQAPLQRCSWLTRGLLLFVLLAMLEGNLIRRPLMNAMVTSAWLFSWLQNLPSLVTPLFLACLLLCLAPRLTRYWHGLVFALLVAAVLDFLVTPLARAGVNALMAYISPPNEQDFIAEPYGWKVMLSAYLTFIEPVLASFMMLHLTRARLSAEPLKRVGQFVGLVLLLRGLLLVLRGLLLVPLINRFYAEEPPLVAWLSVGQFTLEPSSSTAVGRHR